MSAPRRIVVAVDQSQESAHAVDWTVEHFARKDDTLILLHVRPPLSAFDHFVQPDGTGTAVSEGHEVSPEEKASKLGDAFQEISEDILRKAAEPGLEAGFTVEQKVVEDAQQGERICKEAESLGADCLVIGSRGLGMIQSLLMGSTSDYCLHNASCPVLLIRPSHKTASEKRRASREDQELDVVASKDV